MKLSNASHEVERAWNDVRTVVGNTQIYHVVVAALWGRMATGDGHLGWRAMAPSVELFHLQWRVHVGHRVVVARQTVQAVARLRQEGRWPPGRDGRTVGGGRGPEDAESQAESRLSDRLTVTYARSTASSTSTKQLRRYIFVFDVVVLSTTQLTQVLPKSHQTQTAV